ncbi:hypothetical protein MNEG_9276 [Monoraphidium neglectum]|uniref:Uncharacterized protein n=1 Tax=Monoraphidium neglectum TaxID=145388 RepID=A0A0D2KT77_9CHLO|nr:hypothetical protein MNEG_9276 [Monoraphidium neglectum]KIY98688.1 hypothetical protein MNEG_9276 [Monoraphidium neglectum]|eukprot:XP_013897708.1 hypothetical protein MNEG_9276 [Monoraphidium neglectum]
MDRVKIAMRLLAAAAAGAEEHAERLGKENERLLQQVSELEQRLAAAHTGAPPAAAPAPRAGGGGGGDGEVLALNVSGREVWALRAALLRPGGGLLRDMFSGGAAAPPRDALGRPFL